MKTNKIILTLFLLISVIKADIVTNKLNQVKALIQKQDILAIAVDYNIVDTGTAVTDLSTLKSNGFLANFISHSGTIAVNTTNKEITITDTISGAQQYQKDYFTNYLGRDKFANPSISGDDFIATYSFSEDAIKSYNDTSNYTYVQSSTPSGADGETWLDTSSKIVYYNLSGTWTNLKVNKLLIVRAVGELTAITANENDGAIVLTSTTLDKYLYLNGNWELIPQTIPFSYNGSF